LLLDEFDAHKTMGRIGECSVFMAVPTIYYRFLEQPGFAAAARGWQATRLFTCGSAPIRADVLPALEAILGKPVINRYGMTEAFVITSLPLAGPWPQGSVGLPLDGIELRIVADPEPRGLAPRRPDLEPGGSTPRLTRTGEVGSVQIRGPNLFREYWRQPETTRAAFATGWFDTGDLGYLDERGFLTLVGRKHDLIITSGFNVYPQVVERVLNSCPGVRESAVLGVPDPRKGERVAAAVVRDDLTLDEKRLRDFLSERLIDYQRPREIVFVESLPRNALGKVLRHELRERIQQTQ
jgi:malonyl-CoA/methylmalonyl-CoA synthetase